MPIYGVKIGRLYFIGLHHLDDLTWNYPEQKIKALKTKMIKAMHHLATLGRGTLDTTA